MNKASEPLGIAEGEAASIQRLTGIRLGAHMSRKRLKKRNGYLAARERRYSKGNKGKFEPSFFFEHHEKAKIPSTHLKMDPFTVSHIYTLGNRLKREIPIR